MIKPWHGPLPVDDIETFKSLKDIKTIIDVGARTSLDYLDIIPNAELHLFEPWPAFYEWLKEETKDKKNVHVNGYGLGDIDKSVLYNLAYQAFIDSEYNLKSDGAFGEFQIKTLDWYVKENNIKQIDFLKIDTEGYDYKVLLGGMESLKKTRYIQYEHWDNLTQFHDLLEKDFIMEYKSGRNVLCTRRDL